MKVLIVNTSDIEGGAARAAYRLHRALLAEGVDSQMLVQSKASDDFTVVGPIKKIQKGVGKIRPTLDTLPVHRYKNRTKTLFSPAWVPFSDVVDSINNMNPDVVHLHWVAGGMIRIEDIARIQAPIVWSLHDMWPFTGGCHYDENCGAFRRQCGNCKVLQSCSSNDLSRKVHNRKHSVFQKKNDLMLVGVSRWLANEAISSSLFSVNQVVNLPNPIDVDSFSPFEKNAARKLLNLPHDKKLVLFGAMEATSDPRKGYKELSQALKQIQSEDTALVVFGASQPKESAGFMRPVYYLGRLLDDATLRALYSAADVMVVPSLQEAFGQTASEAMACGTPVVAFGATGLLDIVDHKKNGYLAEPFDSSQLAQGIDWILYNDFYLELSNNARKKIVQTFGFKVVAPKYIELYRYVSEKAVQ